MFKINNRLIYLTYGQECTYSSKQLFPKIKLKAIYITIWSSLPFSLHFKNRFNDSMVDVIIIWLLFKRWPSIESGLITRHYEIISNSVSWTRICLSKGSSSRLEPSIVEMIFNGRTVSSWSLGYKLYQTRYGLFLS